MLATLETNRLHPVRGHLLHIDHPRVGYATHGSGVINRHGRATYGLHRLALHASLLAFQSSVAARIEITALIADPLGEAVTLRGLPPSAPPAGGAP